MVQFEWDETKAKSNLRKHGIRFEYAVHAFEDPYALVERDRIEGGEYRWQTLGLVEGVILLLVAHTVTEDEEDEIVRIVSARRATRKERARYDKNRQKESC